MLEIGGHVGGTGDCPVDVPVAEHLAPFKVPRFYTFVDDFPRTVSLKIAKPQISAGISDLRAGSFDRVENRWIQEG